MQSNQPTFLGRLQAISDFTDRLPSVLSIGLSAVLLLLSLSADMRAGGSHAAFPLYYLIPICILGWFVGWRGALAATIIAGVLSSAGLFLATRPASFSAGFLLGRTLTFALALLLGRILAIVKRMIEFLLLGDHLRARIVPIRVGPRLVSIPTRDTDIQAHNFELKPTDIPLLIRPGRAFGSGSHATTQMCLMLLEDHLKPGQVVFDFGSGSGILSIAAAKLGARSVYAVDVDPEAEGTIHENIDLNGLGEVIHFRRGSWPALLDFPAQSHLQDADRSSSTDSLDALGEKGDLLMANILTYIIVEALKEGLTRCVVPGGKLILSGIRNDQWDEIQLAVVEAGLTVIDRREMQEWLAVVVSAPE
ncbi:MAG TPA: 50S ribosomal protein L11 methyltransferase [Anaerolineales bacterium]|nr:50S ribosomal protein L11 methyltransferase [Anaerolineales bacterium]